ncbi:MAG: AI-2E family transporter [Bacteroidales bacterium]|nr:AI-2E family transporter [Bacteroidales bacterium]
MQGLKTTNTLLLIIVTVLIFYTLKILYFIFIPLIFSMFIATLFLPLTRWLGKKKVPKIISILIVILVITGVLKLGSELIRLSIQELLSVESTFIEKTETKLVSLIVSIERFFGIYRLQGENIFNHYFQLNNLFKNLGSTMGFIGNALSMTLMTVFFTILLLSESINFQKLLNKTLFDKKFSSVKIFMKIEKDIIKFIIVKFLISLFTGICISFACLFFDISFPVFWGLLAFILNFIQMIGSVVVVLLLSLFAFVELEPTGILFFFVLSIIAVQVLFGSILEPIFMGKTFSINIITVLIMLMLWGYIWGIPGLIMSIPITVFIKIILEQFPKTNIIASLMTGNEIKVNLSRKK